MKVLSIIQPWATLIALGEKRIETRSWATKHRGPLLIHSSKRIEKFICDREPFYSTLHSHGIDEFAKLSTGMIIARCNLVGCYKIRCVRPVKRDGRIIQTAFLEAGNRLIEVNGNELDFGDYTPERYAWILEDVEIISEPIPAKGQLNLWNFSGKIEA